MKPSTFRLIVSALLVTATAFVLQLQPVSADLSSSTPGSEAERFGLLSAGEYYACGVNSGDIMCWGWASINESRINVPTVVTASGSPFSIDLVTDLDVGGTYFDDAATACIVGNDGAVTGGVWCWGGNAYGQFGNNTSSFSNTYNEPVRAFGNLTGATHVAVGQNHVCVVKADDTVVCTGENSSGQLGNNSTVSSLSPVTVSTGSAALSGVTAISAGGSTTCALSLGNTWCWGAGGNYQLGNLSASNSQVAVQAFNEAGSTAIDVFGPSVCTAGPYGMQCWGETTRTGSNITDTERLGTGSGASDVWGPMLVTAINFIPIAIATTLTHTCALNTAGEVWCFGDNTLGTLGNGSTTDSATGVRVNLPSPVDVITTGVTSTCAVNRAGEMWCWGDGTNSGLGNNSFANQSTPVRITTRTADWTYMGIAPTTTTTTTTTTAPTTTTTTAPVTTTPQTPQAVPSTTTVVLSPSSATIAVNSTTSVPARDATRTASLRELPSTGSNTTRQLIQWALMLSLLGYGFALRKRRAA